MELVFPHCRHGFMIFWEQMDEKEFQCSQLSQHVLPSLSLSLTMNGLSVASYWNFQEQKFISFYSPNMQIARLLFSENMEQHRSLAMAAKMSISDNSRKSTAGSQLFHSFTVKTQPLKGKALMMQEKSAGAVPKYIISWHRKHKSCVYENHKPYALQRVVQLTIKWSLKGITRFSTKVLK